MSVSHRRLFQFKFLSLPRLILSTRASYLDQGGPPELVVWIREDNVFLATVPTENSLVVAPEDWRLVITDHCDILFYSYGDIIFK